MHKLMKIPQEILEIELENSRKVQHLTYNSFGESLPDDGLPGLGKVLARNFALDISGMDLEKAFALALDAGIFLDFDYLEAGENILSPVLFRGNGRLWANELFPWVAE